MVIHPIKCGLLARMSTCGYLSSQISLFHANRSFWSSTVTTNRLSFAFADAAGQISSLRQFHKAVVENVPENATKEMLYNHFSKFGSVLSAERVQNAKKPEFHVIFEDKKEFDTAVYSSSHVIGEKPVNIRPFEAVRIAVYGFSPSSTEKILHDYFSRFGKVVRSDVLIGRSKELYGIVVLYPERNKAKDLFSKVHLIDGSIVRVTEVISTELRHYVSNLSSSTTNESLTKFYSQFGEPLEVKLHRNENRNLYHGVVHFSSQEQVEKAIRSLPHVVDGNEVVFENNTKDFTLFAAQLPPNSTQESLQQYFEQFGTVSKCIIVSNKSSGDSAWLTFSSKQALNLALANRPHSVDIKEITIHPSSENAARKCCLYFGDITPTTTDQMLYDCFSKFGSIVTVNISHRFMTGRPMFYGYVTFTSADEASKLLSSGPHVVDGKEIKVDVLADEPVTLNY